jgi:hypothetical protein
MESNQDPYLCTVCMIQHSNYNMLIHEPVPICLNMHMIL